MRSLWTALIGVIVALACASSSAFASSGCTAVSAGNWNMSVNGGVVSRTDVFDSGDQLTFSFSIGDPEFNGYVFSGSLAAGGAGQSQVSFTAASGLGTLTMTSNRPVQVEIPPRTISVTGSCIAASTSTTTTLSASPNPGASGENITFSAAVSGASPTGTVTFFDGGVQIGSSTLSGGGATYTTSSLSIGSHSITARYAGDSRNDPSTSNVVTQAINQATTTITVASSLNPSTVGQPVTFAATVTGASPTGAVMFLDGENQIGSATLASGIAAFSTSSLGAGMHSITARFGGDANNVGSTSPVLVQTVDLPADSVKLRSLQAAGTQFVSRISSDAISSALADAVEDGLAVPSGSSAANGGAFTFRFAPRGAADDLTPGDYGRTVPSQNGGGLAVDRLQVTTQGMPGQGGWFGWAQIRETGIDQDAAGGFEGSQTNLVAGLTYRVRRDLVVGILGGYEDFGFEAKMLSGRLSGEGWTVGGYAGWRLAPDLRIDAGFARSSLQYDAIAGVAAGSFSGVRWLISGGLTGAFAWRGLEIEPSLRLFAVTENEEAYTDTLGFLQAAHSFGNARAKGGARVRHLMRLSASITAEPYVGLYGDYYFNTDTALTAAPDFASPQQGWSANLITGLRLRHESMQFDIGGEYGGIGNETKRWTLRVHFGVPLQTPDARATRF